MFTGEEYTAADGRVYPRMIAECISSKKQLCNMNEDPNHPHAPSNMVCGNDNHEHNHGPHGSSCVTPGINIVNWQAADDAFLDKMLAKSAKPQVQQWGRANLEFLRATWLVLIPLINGTYGWREDGKTQHGPVRTAAAPPSVRPPLRQ